MQGEGVRDHAIRKPAVRDICRVYRYVTSQWFERFRLKSKEATLCILAL